MNSQHDTANLLRDSVRRALERMSSVHVPDVSAAAVGAAWNDGRWKVFADLGLLGLGVDESFGGSGVAEAETLAAAGELGRAAAAEPFIESIVLGAAAIQALGTPAQKDRWLPRIATGELVVAWAHVEPGWRHPFQVPGIQAVRDREGWTISGSKSCVAVSGDLVIVSAVLEEDGDNALFAIEAKRQGLKWHAAKTFDGRQEALLVLDGVRITADDRLLPGSESVADCLSRLHGDALLCACAEALGAMDRMLELTVQHLRTREQFGTRLSSFQALQHRIADMSVALEEGRSMLMYAAAAWRARAVDARIAVSALKVQLGTGSRFIGEQAVQLHGGLGLAMEYALAPLFLRTTMFASRFGDTEHHLDQLIAAGGLYSRAA